MNDTLERIVDGLAEQGYAVIDNFLEPEEVKAIVGLDAFHEAAASFKKAGIGKNQDLQINEAIRGDYIQWVDRNTAPAPVKVYLDKLQALIQAVNRGLFLSLKDYEVHMTVYPPGSFYKRHLDQFKKDDHRKLSVICYLNEDWREEHGGQLRMYLSDQTVDFLPLAGRLVCFRSDQIEHEVIAATRERRSLTGWMLDQVAELRHL
ncbi:2OG-Fe(II) oxygenase [Parachryseolinea silvisoli]|jgi:SM-20-related protein|uniref:2OG-Fe(II) oxygenase n=1 Tax=Parachryseolinea silvisoli TaxID=2873601 RepID=UPI002265DAB7|nr:2OG-Fe(II) oxygenase [Parachryseolinea silvisoli]MCD9016215.1 2OG-Fe(II) oxygenase [Parachryseolinea silvisoli]